MVTELVFTLVLAFLGAEAFALFRWRGPWRWAALPPLLILAAVVLWILVDPARHYLLALEALIWSFLGLVFLGILAAIRRVAKSMQSRRAGGTP